MMGAYRQGSDPLLDEAIAMHPRMSQFLSQGYRESIDLAAAQQQLVGLVNHDA